MFGSSDDLRGLVLASPRHLRVRTEFSVQCATSASSGCLAVARHSVNPESEARQETSKVTRSLSRSCRRHQPRRDQPAQHRGRSPNSLRPLQLAGDARLLETAFQNAQVRAAPLAESMQLCADEQRIFTRRRTAGTRSRSARSIGRTRPERRRVVKLAKRDRRCLSVMTQITGAAPRPSVQFEHEAEGFVDRFKFVVPEPSNEFAESLERYR